MAAMIGRILEVLNETVPKLERRIVELTEENEELERIILSMGLRIKEQESEKQAIWSITEAELGRW